MVQKSAVSYFRYSFVVTLIGLVAAAGVGYFYSHSVAGASKALFLAMVLVVLEISVSFDNAVVNASVLKEMSPLWRQRFLTWGMLIAVFGMRFVFPLLIVGVIASVSPWGALVLAATNPEEYARLMLSAHVNVAAYGGSFLLLVALKYFFDEAKEIHWIKLIEKPLVRLGKIEAVEIGITLLLIYGNSLLLRVEDRGPFVIAGIFGILTYILVDGISAFLEAPKELKTAVHKAGFGMFLYLNVLDASFSFDGVIGAFAITSNLFIIAIGLGVGAMFVRSLTILLVDKGTLSEFRYLENGAFYAIGALALLMFLGTHEKVPEVVTGLVGAVFIVVSIWSSVRHKRKLNWSN